MSGCYPATGIEVFERTTLRERYWMKTINDRTATIGERFAVKASTTFEGFCWIQVTDGWIRSKSVLPAMPPDPKSTPAPKETGLDPRLPKSTMPQSELPRDEGCYPAAGVELIERTTVRERYWLRAAADGKAAAGERFAVQSSRIFDGICWVEVANGWISSRSVFPAIPPTPAPPSCYNEPHAYLAGQMNVRQSHSVNSSLVGQIKAGDLFEVNDTFKGPTYCWLRIKSGWIARLGIVQSLDSIRLPRIEGDSRFVAQIRRGLDYLKERAPHWYIYVVTNTRSIGRSPEHEGRSTADGRRKHTAILSDHLYPIMELASVLVHEACHMVQFDRGERIRLWDYEGEIRHEKECLRVQRQMVWDIDRNHRYADVLTEMLSWSDAEWMMALW